MFACFLCAIAAAVATTASKQAIKLLVQLYGAFSAPKNSPTLYSLLAADAAHD